MREQQRQFLYFLVGGEQIAFDAIRNEIQRFRIGFLLLQAEPAGNPLRQGPAQHGFGFDSDAGTFKRFEPGGFLAAPVEVGHVDQRDGIGRQRLAVVLQRFAAFLTRFAGGDAQFQQLARGEQGL